MSPRFPNWRDRLFGLLLIASAVIVIGVGLATAVAIVTASVQP